MRSIRRSTILGIVVMLICVLGAVCFLVYRSSRASLEDRNTAIRELLRLQFENKRDEEMLTEARNFATLADLTIQRLDPNEGTPKKLSTLSINEDQMNSSSEWTHNEFVQIKVDDSQWKSLSLQESQAVIPQPAIAVPPHQHVHSWLSVNNRSFRVVSLQEPMRHFMVGRLFQVGLNRDVGRTLVGSAAEFALPRPRRSSSNAAPAAMPRPSRTPVEYNTPMAFIQVAWDDDAHPKIRELRNVYQSEVEDAESKGRQSLAQLRVTLLAIGFTTLGVAIVGGGIIITRGLKPLRTLTDAVSQISEKNFDLPLEAGQMPVEVLPTVEKLKSTLDLLRRAFEREKRAAADISHELRTPIASLNATLDVALRKPRHAEDYRNVLTDCRIIGKEMSSLVERLMTLAYLDAGQDQLRNESVDANDLLKVCGAIGRPLAEAHGLQFRMNLEPDMHLRTDPDKLRQVVMNLLHNAIEYNKPGGEIELTAKMWMPNGLEIDVRDTGIGIAPEIKDKIFERFYRADPSRTNTGVHAGLGLAIVKEYVTRLGGTLELESHLGEGTEFRLRVPNS